MTEQSTQQCLSAMEDVINRNTAAISTLIDNVHREHWINLKQGDQYNVLSREVSELKLRMSELINLLVRKGDINLAEVQAIDDKINQLPIAKAVRGNNSKPIFLPGADKPRGERRRRRVNPE